MKEVVLSQKMEKEETLKHNFIERDATQSAAKSLDSNLIKVIIGPRRAGKSVFSFMLLKNKDFAYLNFDDERLIDVEDYDEILKEIAEVYGNKKYFLFDEIQNLPKWELFINRLQRQGINLMITGSNSQLLSTELSTHLTGRHMIYTLLPFSFNEYLKAKDIRIEGERTVLKQYQGEILRTLDGYMINGGFPETVLTSIDPKKYLQTLLDGILLKDVVQRHNVKQPKTLYKLSKYLISNAGNEATYNKLRNNLGEKSVHTIQKYVGYLEEAFVLFQIERYSHKLKEQIKSPRKIYAIDNGLINAVSQKTTTDSGRLMENLVAVELLKKKTENSDLGFYYFRNQNGKEVDFVIKNGQKITELIQVCYNLKEPSTLKREIEALNNAGEELNCCKKTIITWDEEEKQDIEKVPLWKWLLKKDAESTLSKDDYSSLNSFRKEKKSGKLVSHQDLKKKFDL